MKSKMKNDKNYRELYDRFNDLLKEASKHGINDVIFGAISKGKEVEMVNNENRKMKKRIAIGVFVTVFGLSILIGVAVEMFEVEDIKYTLFEEKCFVDNKVLLMEIARPPVNCDMCKDLTTAPVEYNITSEEFVAKYAYSSIPVLIKDAAKEWRALETFNFHFFKNFYNTIEDAFYFMQLDCEFFPYKSNYFTLEEVLNMPDARANLTEGENSWYIGWSNCHQEISAKLRKYYDRPYFLPNDSESSIIDWVFMGGAGHGARVHLDYVSRPSWQAQISGKKTWTLIPSPECQNVCHTLNITVHKGDIIIVDTTSWYHATYIHPGEISITIGSEYD